MEQHAYAPSRFDRMLEKADEIIRQGFGFVTDEDVPPFEDLRREFNVGPVRAQIGWDD